MRLETRKIRNLPISAASGLVYLDSWLYVVADDELHLGVFHLDNAVAPAFYRIFPGELPAETAARKKMKPDLEGLVGLSRGLLALPSGSEPNRTRGALVALEKNGTLAPNPRTIDFAPLYAHLSKTFRELNIEGAAATERHLKLFQRGNGALRENATIELNLGAVSEMLGQGKPLGPELIQSITPHQLGELNGVPLSFTDAVSLGDGSCLFLAAAEATYDTYSDGPCAGSVVGILETGGGPSRMLAIAAAVKAEGIAVTEVRTDRIEFLFVTDADDPKKQAELYSGTLFR